MIANALVFLLGFAVAALLALLVAPILWRKAQSFARREYMATLPASANEIRAEFDMVRAEAAMKVRRAEIDVGEMRERVAGALSDLGRAHGEIADLSRAKRELEGEIEAYGRERDKLRQTFSAFEDKERILNSSLDEAQRDGWLNAEELEALAQRFREVSDLAEERKIELVAAEARTERLTDTLRSLERASVEKDTLIRLLRAEAEKAPTAAKPRQPMKAGAMPGMATGARPASPAAERQAIPTQPAASLRELLDRPRPELGLPGAQGGDPTERLSEIAAHAILAVATREGETSALAEILGRDDIGEAPANGVSLAERVRRLADEMAQAGEAPRRAE
ncbi:hypothetical protein [Aureimonas psammosilenae]|uniref:hypothetical protein n=1 Tax=Aureimonas psammosilenae TaxID=2495496 RepID=UPI0012607D3C|nr:hypothetical protein [Aureimonas psammosilenae]